MEEIRARMSEIEDHRHPSYVKYPLADILIIVMCAVLCGLDTLGDLVIYAKNKKDFLAKEFGIEEIPSKATVSTHKECFGNSGKSNSMMQQRHAVTFLLAIFRGKIDLPNEIVVYINPLDAVSAGLVGFVDNNLIHKFM